MIPTPRFYDEPRPISMLADAMFFEYMNQRSKELLALMHSEGEPEIIAPTRDMSEFHTKLVRDVAEEVLKRKPVN